MKYIPFSIQSKDGLKLQCRAWISHIKKPGGIVVLLHDLGDHSARFSHVAEAFSDAGYHFFSFDLRGHGLSEGKRGHSPRYLYLMNDIEQFIQTSTEKPGTNSLPIILYGHGFGGNLSLNYVLRRRPNISGVIVTCPMLENIIFANTLKFSLIALIANIWPAFQINSQIRSKFLSRDPAFVKAYQDDVYTHHHVSARLARDIVHHGKYILRNASHWDLPLLLMHGADDPICSPAASKLFADNGGGLVDFILLEGFLHEIHNDFEKEIVIDKMINWMTKEIK